MRHVTRAKDEAAGGVTPSGSTLSGTPASRNPVPCCTVIPVFSQICQRTAAPRVGSVTETSSCVAETGFTRQKSFSSYVVPFESSIVIPYAWFTAIAACATADTGPEPDSTPRSALTPEQNSATYQVATASAWQ